MSLESRLANLERAADVDYFCVVDVGVVRQRLIEDAKLLATYGPAEPLSPPVPSGNERLDAQRLAVWQDNRDLETFRAAVLDSESKGRS